MVSQHCTTQSKIILPVISVETTMMHLTFATAITVTLAFSVGIVNAIPDLSKRQSAVKIMALGDSITGSPVWNSS